jgi:hypothetical protein
VNPGFYGPYNAQTFSGYGPGELAAGSDPTSGMIAAGDTVDILYLYDELPITATINVVHKYKLSGDVLKSDTYIVNPGGYGPYDAMMFTGYGTGVLDTGSYPASGMVSAGQTIEILYLYDKLPTTATINVAHKDKVTGDVLKSDTYTVNPGA